MTQMRILPNGRRTFLRTTSTLVGNAETRRKGVDCGLCRGPSRPMTFVFCRRCGSRHTVSVRTTSPRFRTFKGTVGRVLTSSLVVRAFWVGAEILRYALVFVASFVQPQPVSAR